MHVWLVWSYIERKEWLYQHCMLCLTICLGAADFSDLHCTCNHRQEHTCSGTLIIYCEINFKNDFTVLYCVETNIL